MALNKPKIAIAKNDILIPDTKIKNILDFLKFPDGYPGGKNDLFTGGISEYGIVPIRCYMNFKIQAAAPVLILAGVPIFSWNMDMDMQRERGMYGKLTPTKRKIQSLFALECFDA